MEKNTNLQQDGDHKKVVLQKQADRVAIAGPYSKRELRRLLLSSVSLSRYDDKDSTKLDSTIKKKTGLSQVDLDKIKEGKVDEISEEADRTLKDLNVTKDAINSARRKEEDDVEGEGDKRKEEKDLEQKDLERKDLERKDLERKDLERKDLERKDLERKDLERKDLERKDLEQKGQKSFKKLLYDRGLSESLVKSLMQNGLTDEYVRLLKALGLTDQEIERLKMLWQNEIYDSTSLADSEDSCSSPASSSDDDLSPESLYLKNFLSKVLARALRDIASKKPYDPIEYLGHWLLHLKICEEREKQRKDFEMELMIERERYRMINIEDQEIIEIESGGQECDDDWIGTLDL